MLPGEKIRDYEALQAELYEEWGPDGPTEHGLVDRLVALFWRKQRLERYDQAKLKQQIAKIRSANQISRAVENLKRWVPQFSSALTVEAVEEILSELSAVSAFIVYAKVPWTALRIRHNGVHGSRRIYRASSQPIVSRVVTNSSLVNPAEVENELARSDRLDESIDRTTKRLMQVKTAKRILPNMRRNANTDAKSIDAQSLANPIMQAHDSEQNVKLIGKVEIHETEPELATGSGGRQPSGLPSLSST